MKRPLHRFITILLLLSFSISGLLYVFYDIAQLDLKVAAGNEIAAHEHLQIIKLPVSGFDNNNDELWHNGKLYDVSSYTIINDTVFVTVLHDGDEEALVKTIADSFEPNEIYTSDNGMHVVKHRIHTSDDSKILTAPYRMRYIAGSGIHLFLSQSVMIFTEAHSAILKPPPKYRRMTAIC